MKRKIAVTLIIGFMLSTVWALTRVSGNPPLLRDAIPLAGQRSEALVREQILEPQYIMSTYELRVPESTLAVVLPFPSGPYVTSYPNPNDYYYRNPPAPCNTQIPCGAGVPTWTPIP